MLRTTGVKSSTKNLRLIDKDITIDSICGSNQIDGAKSQVNFLWKLSKTKLLAEPSSGSGFLTPVTRLAFARLEQVFIKAPILYHFDLESHVWVETDISGYAISWILSRLILDKFGQWYLVALFSEKRILAKTQYKTHNNKLFIIVEAFKN